MPGRNTRRFISAALLPLALSALLGPAAAGDTLSAVEAAQFDAALAPLGLSRSDLTLRDADIGLWGGDKYKLKALDFLRSDVTNCGPWARSISTVTLNNQHSLGALVTGAHSRLDNGIRLGLTGDPLESYRARISELGDAALATALAELGAGTAAQIAADPDYQSVPPRVRSAAALVLFAVPEAQRDRSQGLLEPLAELGLDLETAAGQVFAYSINTFAEEDDTTGREVIDDRADTRLVESLLDSVDWNYLHRGSTLLAIAAQEAQKMLLPPPPPAPPAPGSAAPPAPTAEELASAAALQQELAALASAPFSYTFSTPLGELRLSGIDADRHAAGPCLLCIDCGGSDSYAAAGQGSALYPIGISIDLSGNDVYSGSDEAQGGPASGIFGTGILIDVAGDDSYTCAYAGEGAGIFGTGVLYDLAGDDSYESFGHSQASGSFGSGILADLAGDDTYHTFKYSQAYGGTRGCGLLLDCAGDDRYLADLQSHFNGGLYGPTHHVHFVQGSAYGRRADLSDGHSWAGGCGMLIDGAGDDFYEADCYGQGNSYWHAIGMLVDKSGNDVYRAGQYSQASAPHFAVGILQDDSGDDRYVCSIRQSLGHGRDWSIAWLEDSAGDDWYQGARTTLGVSHVNSISVFWDKLGADTYIMKGPGLGDSEPEPNGSPRDWLLSLGLFIDGAGQDGYYLLPGDDSYEGSNSFSGEVNAADLPRLTKLDFAGDGKSWQRTVTPDSAPGYKGSGLDL
ncbi:hypothetical protein IT575_06230 [bacterium]|nr:hypothetical protein [bacterium]